MRNDGGFDFEAGLPTAPANAAQWTAKALPSIVTLAASAHGLANPSFALPAEAFNNLSGDDDYQILAFGAARIRVHKLDPNPTDIVLLPLDRLFEVRLAAALRLWRGMTGQSAGSDGGALTRERRDRLVLTLRALDGRLSGATHPQIATGLFDIEPISKRDWISHEFRDRTGRLVRHGMSLMKGGYRQLLVYPYRRRI